MKKIYRLAQQAFVDLGLKQPPGKAYQMGFVDGYLEGFRKARSMANDAVLLSQSVDPLKLSAMIESLGEIKEDK